MKLKKVIVYYIRLLLRIKVMVVVKKYLNALSEYNKGKDIVLSVRSDNDRAIQFYKK